MKFFFPLTLGYVITNVVATTLALVLLQPFVSPMFGPYIRSKADGLAFGPLLAGYLVITLVLAWLLPRVRSGQTGWSHGATIGLALGTAVGITS